MEVDAMRGTEANSKLAGKLEALALELVRTHHIPGDAASQLAANASAGRQEIVATATTWPQDIEQRMLVGFCTLSIMPTSA